MILIELAYKSVPQHLLKVKIEVLADIADDSRFDIFTVFQIGTMAIKRISPTYWQIYLDANIRSQFYRFILVL